MVVRTRATGGDDGGSSVYIDGQGQEVRLYEVPEMFSVRFEPGKRSLSREATSLLAERNAPQFQIENYNIAVYRSEVRDRAMSVLSKEDAVEHVAKVFRRDPQSSEVILVTKRFIAQFKPGVTRGQIDTINESRDVRIVRLIDPDSEGHLGNTFLLEGLGKDERTGIDYSNAYHSLPEVEYSEPDLIQRRGVKHAAVAPDAEAEVVDRTAGERAGDYLDRQWHLDRANVIAAWRQTKGDPAIKIAILDDGVDAAHPELRDKIVKQADFAKLREDGTPELDGTPKNKSDKHGTACAGVATAAGKKSFGSAPGCSLIAVRTPDYLGTADEAAMFLWAADQGADVISCSWGPADGTHHKDPLPTSTAKAIREITRKGGRGRGGKGIPIFWAAGNGDESVMDDGYAANPDVMAIAASTSADARAWYSDKGTALCVCAPSSGDSAAGEKAIFTADRHGTDGYNKGAGALADADYCADFGGTSSATPLVAGIAALMLSKNPELTPAEIRRLLQSTAVKIGGAGDYHDGHSDNFGYGLVDADAAVRAAAKGSAPAANEHAARPTIKPKEKTIKRSAAAPTFLVDPRPNTYYAVEVATSRELFDPAHKAERSAANFFGSWKIDPKGPALSGPRYQLPATAWVQLKADNQLYYRAITSSQSGKYVDWVYTVKNDELDQLPSIKIEGARAVKNVPDEAHMKAPRVITSAEAERDGDPPLFTILPGENANQYFAIEVARKPHLLSADTDEERSASNFFGSWESGRLLPLDGITNYTLPSEVWERLRKADKLYYRVVTAPTADAKTWDEALASTEDADVGDAPAIDIVQTRADRLVEDAPVRSGAAGKAADEARWRQLEATPEGNGEVAVDRRADRSVNGGGRAKIAADPGIDGPIPDRGERAPTGPTPEYPQARRFVAAKYFGQVVTTPRKVKRIVIHITDGTTLQGTVSWFQKPEYNGKVTKVSAHYVVGRDGEVVQMVRHDDVAYHAHSANLDSIGIEHVAKKTLKPTPIEYAASAALVRWLCEKYKLPMDRVRILGHKEADPTTTHTGCPTDAWNWDYYMRMVTSGMSLPPP